MKTIFVDGRAGAAGDMLLGALMDAGFPLSILQKELAKLNLPVKVSAKRVTRRHIEGCRALVEFEEEKKHRRLPEIKDLISRGGFSSFVEEKAIAVFERLGEAEAKAHGCSLAEVHFHEVGAVDAIVDIVGSCMGLEYLGMEQMFCSPLRVGYGEIHCRHGIMPVPAPATLHLLKGVPFFAGEYEGEWTTPTGAAILTTLCSVWREIPLMTVEKIGCGAGLAERDFPNLLRLLVGEVDISPVSGDEVEVLETTLDDMNPEIIPYLGEKLQELPILDYQVTPVVMKKGRVGNNLTVLTDPALASRAMEVIFKETTTLGIRRSRVKRTCLQRESVELDFQGEKIKVKVGFWQGEKIQAAPEYEDCRRAAKALNLPLQVVYDEAKKIIANIAK